MHQRQVAHDLEKRLHLFQSGSLSTLWAELAQRKPLEQPARTRARAKMEEEDTLPESQVEKIRALVEEGALSKATRLLLAAGLANSQDPDVERKLRELHPTALPHLIAGGAIPMSAATKLAAEEDDGESLWTRRA